MYYYEAEVNVTYCIEVGLHYTLRDGITTLGAPCYNLKPRVSTFLSLPSLVKESGGI